MSAGPIRAQVAATLLGGVLLATGSAVAIDLEKLVMPGPLSRVHADIESQCQQCHQPFAAGAEPNLCSGCHEPIADDIRHERGFHGRHAAAVSSPCRSCHSEHVGRDAPIAELDHASFDHAFTDFALEGAHIGLDCGRCHEPGQRFRDADPKCAGCHEEDDRHRGRLTGDCGNCHGPVRWGDGRFDHDSTGFELEGGHASLTCGLCHTGDRYEDTPDDCASCHRMDDSHEGRFGVQCATCHDTVSWRKESSFDHARDAKFALDGAHARAKCESCHRLPPREEKLGTGCASCHLGEDAHRGLFGRDCGTCHAESSWNVASFDHAKNTRFALQGAHAGRACDSCHRAAPDVEALDMRCASCHAADDVHRGRLGKDCGECHDQRDFAGNVLFDHDITRFPLLGLHATAPCEACHDSGTFEGTDVSCVACHRAEDEHDGKLGADCQRCHGPNGWDRWQFDHVASADFPLTGGHQNLSCEACHRQAAGSELRAPRDCQGCHRRDDAHRGAFGRNCQLCHREDS